LESPVSGFAKSFRIYELLNGNLLAIDLKIEPRVFTEELSDKVVISEAIRQSVGKRKIKVLCPFASASQESYGETPWSIYMLAKVNKHLCLK
jgi:hypothetical protein